MGYASLAALKKQYLPGFLDGFTQEPESSTDGEYTQGYLTAEQLRTARYPKDLPDRG